VILSGTWNNPRDECVSGGGSDISGQEFLELAIAALIAMWPDCYVMVLQAHDHLPAPPSVGSCCYHLQAGHNITMLCPPDAYPIKSSQTKGLGVLFVGNRTRLLFPFISEEADPYNLGANRECVDIMAFLHSALMAGQRFLQLGCNRAQLMVAFKDYVASAGPARAMPSALPLIQTPPFRRARWERNGNGMPDMPAGVVCPPCFPYMICFFVLHNT